MIFTPDCTRSSAACCAAVAGTVSTPTMMFFSRTASGSSEYSETATFPIGDPIFAEHGINIAAIFDNDPEMVGRPVGNVGVTDYARLAEAVREKNIIVGVLAVPADSAQGAANDLVDAGVKIIFNYSEALLDVPGDVTVHTSNPAVDLLHALYFHLA